MIFFDTETNGLDTSYSLLSLCMVKGSPIFDEYGKLHVEIIDIFYRFYFPKEKYNSKAISINGLDEKTLIEKRNHAEYPKYFEEDHQIVLDFIENSNKRFVAHNISFDARFVPFEIYKKFCTMQNTINIVKKCWNNYYKSYKWPRLEEAIRFFNIDTSDIEAGFHDARFDVLCTIRLFEAIYNRGHCVDQINKFLKS